MYKCTRCGCTREDKNKECNICGRKDYICVGTEFETNVRTMLNELKETVLFLNTQISKLERMIG